MEQTTIGIGKLATALSKAQSEFPNIDLNRKVEVRTKTGGTYTFKYATLGNILKAVRPVLAKYELAISQPFTDSSIVTRLLHSSGESIGGMIPIPGFSSQTNPTMQELGSQITYLRRYALVSILGIVGEEDDDANMADGNEIKDIEKEPVRPATAPKAGKPASKKATPAQTPSEAPQPAPEPAKQPERADWGHPKPGDGLISVSDKAKIIEAFKLHGITEADLTDKAGYPLEKWTVAMKQVANQDYAVLHMKYCTKEQWLKSTAPAQEFTPIPQ